MNKRILVTGGAGFVGRTLSRLLANSNDICIVDTMKFGDERLSSAELKSFSLKRVDICDGEAVKAVIEAFRPDTIVHLAANHFIPDCENRPGEATNVNIGGTVNLLAACPQDCRFVLASSGAVYSPSEALHHEQTSAVGPRDVYGFTKLHDEHYVRYFAENRGFPAVVVRLFNVVGPGETNPHLLPELVAQLKAGQSTLRLGNMWPKRDYIDVRDAASGFSAVALRGEVTPGEVSTVNLGTSQQYSVTEIVDRLRGVTGIPIAVEEDSRRVRTVDRPFLGADIGEVQRRFGWGPSYTLGDALESLWRDPDLSWNLRAAYNLQ